MIQDAANVTGLPSTTTFSRLAPMVESSTMGRALVPGYILIGVFWLLIFLQGYPAPFVDDLAYIGAALNLVQHHVFSNPYNLSLVSLDSSGLFLAYMPLHSYILAGWLRLFGISFLSLSLFSTLAAALVSIFIYRWMPVGNRLAGLAAATGIVVMVYLLLGGAGLRPDALGLAFFCFGLDAVRSRSETLFFLKNLTLALSVITFPNLAATALLVSLATLVFLAKTRPSAWAHLVRITCWTGLAYALAFLLMLWCIDFRLGDFLHSLRLGERFAAMGVADRNTDLFSPYRIAKWFLIQSAFLVLILWLLWGARKKENPFPIFLLLATSFLAYLALFYSSLSSASGGHTWAFVCLIFALYFGMAHFRRPLLLLPWWIFVAIFLFGNGHTAFQGLLCHHQFSKETNQSLVARLKNSPGPLFVDCCSAREIFDYRLPPNCYDFDTSSSTGWGSPQSLATMRPGSALVSVLSRVNLVGATVFPPDSVPVSLRLFGFTIGPIFANPYDLVLITH